MQRQRFSGGFLAAVVIACFSHSPAFATDSDQREISGYALSESGLSRFTQATQNLRAIPNACVREDDDDSSNQSLDQMVAKLESIPGAKAAVQSAGMTSREYVVFMFSMMEAGLSSWAVSQPGGKLPPGVSQANVDFYRKHEAAMAAIGENDPCDAESGEEEEAEE